MTVAQAATAARNDALVELNSINERTRLFYGLCSDLREKTPELARIGFHPKRGAGAAESPAFPGTPGTATYNATAQMLSVAALPEHTTTLRAYRQLAGGAPEEAGHSTTISGRWLGWIHGASGPRSERPIRRPAVTAMGGRCAVDSESDLPHPA